MIKTKKEILENLSQIIKDMTMSLSFGYCQIINKNSNESFTIKLDKIYIKFLDYRFMVNDDNLNDFDVYFADFNFKKYNTFLSQWFSSKYRKLYVTDFIYADLKLMELLGGESNEN